MFHSNFSPMENELARDYIDIGGVRMLGEVLGNLRFLGIGIIEKLWLKRKYRLAKKICRNLNLLTFLLSSLSDDKSWNASELSAFLAVFKIVKFYEK